MIQNVSKYFQRGKELKLKELKKFKYVLEMRNIPLNKDAPYLFDIYGLVVKIQGKILVRVSCLFMRKKKLKDHY